MVGEYRHWSPFPLSIKRNIIGVNLDIESNVIFDWLNHFIEQKKKKKREKNPLLLNLEKKNPLGN